MTGGEGASERVPALSLDRIERDVDVAASIQRVIDSRRYVLGSEVARFERAFAAYCGVEHCVGVANGTDALEIALRGLDVGVGARVLVVANAGHYSSTAVRAIGAIPEYVDIDRATMTMSAERLSATLEARTATDRPAAVIVTHLYGQLADIDDILETASRRAIPVIEDCAQAHGASRRGVRAGAFATIGCFSFYPTKNLGAVGDAGALVTDDSALAERLRSLRQYGWGDKYHVDIRGGRNSRLDEMQAAVLNDRLPHLDDWNNARRMVAATYREQLGDSKLLLPTPPGDDSVAHLYVVRLPERDAFRRHLAAMGIDSEVHFPVPDQQQVAYVDSREGPELPETVAACSSVVTLPCYPGLSRGQQERVIEAAQAFYPSSGR